MKEKRRKIERKAIVGFTNSKTLKDIVALASDT